MDYSVEDRRDAELGWEGKSAPCITLSLSEHRGVDRQTESLVARGCRPLHQVRDQPPILPNVQLEPKPACADSGDLLYRSGAECG